MSRTGQQQRAIDLRDSDVFLRAGAGTGKTGVLVDRYCAAVADDEVTPEQILAFTFTERAAGELRRRIRRRLVRLAGEANDTDPDLALRLEEAVRSLGAAPITTIHGFCRRLLAAHPVAAGLDPRFRVLDASEARRIAWAAFDSALEDLIAAGNEADERVLAVYGVQRARGIVLAAHEELRSRGEAPCLPPVQPRDLGAALGRLHAAAVAVDGARGGNPEENACFARARDLTKAAGRQPTLAELEALEVDSSTKIEERRACHNAIAEAIAVAIEPTAGLEAYEVLGRLLERFSVRFAESKAGRSGLDFEDLQLRAVSLLRDSAGIGASWRERFRHLLVDEFQDTNALQLELIAQLRGPDSHLFVVGDRFQAIYGFRHADIDVFNREEELFREKTGAEVLSLTGNFRSRPGVIAAANALGAATMPGFAQLSAGREVAEGGSETVELLVTETGKWAEADICLERRTGDGMPAECIAEARNVAQRLRAIADEQDVEPGDMVVLLRAFTHVDAFEEALDRVGLAPYVAGGGGYWSQQQTQDLISLLSAVANPLADEQLLGVLASPACGVSPDTMWLLRRGIGRKRSLWRARLAAVGGESIELEDPDAIAAISAAERERLAALHAVLTSLRSLGPRLPLEALVERAITGSGYDLGVLGADHGPARFANVTKLMRLARDFERVEGRDLRGFLDFAALAAAQDDEPPAAVEAEEGEGVKIMTIHSAKGLEFPIVAVAELGRETVRGSRAGELALGRAGEDPLRAGLRLARIGRSPLDLFHHAELSEEAISRDEAEELRLAYVALTRAQERLILSGIRKTTEHSDPRSKSVLRRFLEHCGDAAPEDGATILLPAAPSVDGAAGAPVEVRVGVSAPTAQEGERLSRRNPPAPSPEPKAGRPPIVHTVAPPAPVRALSYSTLHEHARCGYRFYVERVIGLGVSGRNAGESDGSPGRDHALHFGNTVHELLRWSAEHRWAEPSKAVVDGALARQGLSSQADAKRARELVAAWRVSELAREIAGGTASMQPEHPFLVELAGATVRGSIDLLVTRPGEAPLLVDYKTNRLDGRTPAEVAEEYETQRQIYALAAARGLGAERIRVVYAFLERPEEPVVTELGPEELAEASATLGERIRGIAAGDFEVTPNPTWPLCGDCPARARLCPAPAKPKRDEAPQVAA